MTSGILQVQDPFCMKKAYRKPVCHKEIDDLIMQDDSDCICEGR